MKDYDTPTFRLAVSQFDQAAEAMHLDHNLRERLKQPQRSLVVSVPVRMDDDRVEVFTGYRVQHDSSRGPSKGGVRYHPDVNLGEVAALAMWMSWKTSLVGLPYGGAKGGVIVDPHQLSETELEHLSRRYMQEMVNFFGPHTDVPAPDVGTNEKIMGWMMDTYSNHVGHLEPAIVTGKPISLGGSQGRREATGAGGWPVDDSEECPTMTEAMELPERDSMEFDVVIVGAGPAGLCAAIRLKEIAAEKGEEISVVVLEKGSEVGAHILSGAVVDPIAIDKIFPDWREEADHPFKTPVTDDRFYLLGHSGELRLPTFMMPPRAAVATTRPTNS